MSYSNEEDEDHVLGAPVSLAWGRSFIDAVPKETDSCLDIAALLGNSEASAVPLSKRCAIPRNWQIGGQRPELGRSLSADVNAGGALVSLHIYDLSHESIVQWLNSLLLPVKMGAFHAAVEVGGLEWSFASDPRQLKPGVQCAIPRADLHHHFRETLELGRTALTAEEITATLRDLIEEYPGTGYDLLHRNCCHFADDFCKRLGVGPMPGWVYRLARIAAQAHGAVQAVFPSTEKATCTDSSKAQVSTNRAYREVDNVRLANVLNHVDSLMSAGRACEVFPVSRALSMTFDEAGSGFLDRVDLVLRSGCVEVNDGSCAAIATSSANRVCSHSTRRNGTCLSAGGC